MLEKILKLDCKDLVSLDPLSLTFKEDEKRTKFLQYYSLIECFLTNILRNYFPDLESSYSFDGHDSTAKLTSSGMTCYFSDSNGVQEARLEFDENRNEKSQKVVDEICELYRIFNKLSLAKRKDDFRDLTIPDNEFSSDQFSLAVYNTRTGKTLSFFNSQGKQVFLEIDE